MKLKARPTKEMFYSSDSGFRILSFSPVHPYPQDLELSPYGTFTVKGNNIGYFEIGKTYEIVMDFVEMNEKYRSPTYEVTDCPSMRGMDFKNLSHEESKKIMMQCTSSENIADSCLDAYPDFIYKMLTEGKDSFDLKKIYGVGEAYITAYERELLARYKWINIMLKYAPYKFSVQDCQLLYKTYKTNELVDEVMSETPYKVLTMDLERSFVESDRLLKELRSDLLESPQRCEACIVDILHRNEYDGCTWINANDMYKVMKEDYNVSELLNMVVDVVKESDGLYYDDETKRLSLLSTYNSELQIAEYIKSKLNSPHVWDIDWQKYQNYNERELTDEQADVLRNVCENDIVILRGFSGGGKSFTVKNLLDMCDENHKSYTLLAPTGKASMVLSSQTGRTAMTCHLKCLRDGEIDTDLLIIDETTMVSISIMKMILNCISNEDIKILFVGDTAQIPSIGLGKLFKDMIDSGVVPITTLTKIFRYNSDGAIFVATETRNGNSIFNSDKLVSNGNEYKIGDNFKFIETNDNNIEDVVMSEYEKLLKSHKLRDVTLLTCMNVGEIGTRVLNEDAQLRFNPPKANEVTMEYGKGKNKQVFRVGSIVINTKNDYRAVTYETYIQYRYTDLSTEDYCDAIIVNGEMGTIREIIPNEGMVIDFDDKLIFVPKSKVKNIHLGFSITTFKAQGSTMDYIIVVVSNKQQRMLNRNLLYTAITRMAKKCICVGQIDVFENALSQEANDERKTWLKDLLVK